MTLAELRKLLGWTQENSDWLRDQKKVMPNHRRNRARNKAARASRRSNR